MQKWGVLKKVINALLTRSVKNYMRHKRRSMMFLSFMDSAFEVKDLYLIMTHMHASNHANMKFTIRDILNYPCGLKVIVKTVSKYHFSASFSKQFEHF